MTVETNLRVAVSVAEVASVCGLWSSMLVPIIIIIYWCKCAVWEMKESAWDGPAPSCFILEKSVTALLSLSLKKKTKKVFKQ